MYLSFMKYRLLLLVPFAAAFSGCATGYCARGFRGGYSEIMVNPDSFVVTYSGNGFTSSEDAIRYTLLRASELTIQNGYNYFIILNSADRTSSENYSNTYENASGSAKAYNYSNYSSAQFNGSASSSTYSGTIVKPGMTISIKCFKDKFQYDDAIDARFYWEMNNDL